MMVKNYVAQNSRSNVTSRNINEGEKAKVTKRLSEKAARAEKAARIWNNNPLLAGCMNGLSETQRRNSAIMLTNEARFIKGLTEAETSSEFAKMAPANVMRLVQMTMVNENRGNVFYMFPMETARDAIYYIKTYVDGPMGSKFAANKFANRSDFYGVDDDPYGLGYEGVSGQGPKRKNTQVSNNTLQKSSRKMLYEMNEDRFVEQLQNGTVSTSGSTATFTFQNDAFQNGADYVPGYAVIYANNNPNAVIAYQDNSSYEFYVAPEFLADPTDQAAVNAFIVADDSNQTITVDFSKCTKIDADGKVVANPLAVPAGVQAFARFEGEGDFAGDTMGTMRLLMSVHELRPHRASIGLSWTKYAEITLGQSFDTVLDETLLAAAADAMTAQQDYRAFKDAYRIARTNPSNYTIHFNAAYTGTEKVGNSNAVTFAKDSYVDNAQTLSSAIELASAAIFEDRRRGAVNQIVVGVDVVPYIKLNAGFSTTGAQEACGVYRIGALDGVPVYRAPLGIIPKNEMLCVFKNAKVENDVAIAIGTLVPLVSARLDYPTFHSEAGLATYGDRAILNRLYLARIVIDGLKDIYKAGIYQNGAASTVIPTTAASTAPAAGETESNEAAGE